MTAPRIFVSYRRDDAAGEAGRLADHLHKRFGPERVFLDIETIEPGTDFVQVLQRSLKETAAVLVVIGRRWADITDAAGARRLDDPADFVRQEVEAALGSRVPVVPVLVQGAALPRAEQLPATLAPLITRQAASLDHAEFHADAERLCDRLAPLVQPARRGWWPPSTRVAVAAAVVVLLAAAGGYAWFSRQASERGRVAAEEAIRRERTGRVAALLETASNQRERRQFGDAVKTVEAALELDPAAADARTQLEDVAMQWLREVQGDENGTFGKALQPALAIVDRALPGSTGPRRADLIAHQGWATFLLWRDGDRTLRPEDRYREALAIDAGNPYANAMLAHWTLWRGDDVDEAARLFSAALRGRRAVDVVRTLQWAAYGNDSSMRSQVETVRLADAMRRESERLTPRQSQTMWSPFFFVLDEDERRQQLLRALMPDDYIATLHWAFDDFFPADDGRRMTLRYYLALLDAEAGRQSKARKDLTALRAELAGSSGSLLDAVQAALKRFS